MTSAIAAEPHRPRRVRRRSHRHRSHRRLNPVIQELLLIFAATLMFLFLAFFFGPVWAAIGLAAFALLPTLCSTSTRNGRRHAAPDFNQQFVSIGRLLLLFAALLIFFPLIRSEPFQDRMAVFNAPAPSDCDWSSSPVGDKNCHYEHTLRHLDAGDGDQIVVEWHRVND